MPTYQYRCAGCNEETTKFWGIQEDVPELFCQACNSSLKRVYSSIGVTFNGSGFYRTDNRR